MMLRSEHRQQASLVADHDQQNKARVNNPLENSLSQHGLQDYCSICCIL